jgi:MraZ protein
LFTGTHACTIGESHELTLPPTMRQQLGTVRSLYAVPGADGTVWLYTSEGLERWSEQLDRSPAADSKVRRARRVCFAQAEACPVDGEGRTRLPDALASHAGTCGTAVLVGVRDHFELWDASRWDSYLRGHGGRAAIQTSGWITAPAEREGER